MKQTEWNKKLISFSGKIVYCHEYEESGLSTEGHIVNDNGSLCFFTELKKVTTKATKPDFKNYWNSTEKNNFLTILKNKKN